MSELKKLITEALKDQKEMFGDDFFERLDIAAPNSAEKTIAEAVPPKSAGVVETNLFMEDFQKAASLEELDAKINSCMKCELGKSRTKFVFGTGDPNADALLIGEAPGADEDKQGEPFVGRAGKLLNDILKAIHFEREDIFIANILKCRPPGNRNPLPAEMEMCKPYLHKQIELINPKVILCLGLVSANSLLGKKESLTRMRGKVFDFDNRKVMVTYHPAALLRNPNWKKGCWEDVQKFRALYDSLSGK